LCRHGGRSAFTHLTLHFNAIGVAFNAYTALPPCAALGAATSAAERWTPHRYRRKDGQRDYLRLLTFAIPTYLLLADAVLYTLLSMARHLLFISHLFYRYRPNRTRVLPSLPGTAEGYACSGVRMPASFNTQGCFFSCRTRVGRFRPTLVWFCSRRCGLRFTARYHMTRVRAFGVSGRKRVWLLFCWRVIGATPSRLTCALRSTFTWTGSIQLLNGATTRMVSPPALPSLLRAAPNYGLRARTALRTCAAAFARYAPLLPPRACAAARARPQDVWTLPSWFGIPLPF